VSFGIAGAITYGEPDDGEHPYVGMMLFYVPADEGWYSCTGSLVDAGTVLTAGHCTAWIGTGLEEEGIEGGTDVFLNFSEEIDLSEWPSRADFPNADERNPARLKWLEDSPEWTRGTAWPHPEYDDFSQFPATYDVGIVELDEEVRLDSYAELPDVGILDYLSTKRGHSRDVLFETSGYGIQEVVPEFMSEDWRYKATSMFVNLRSHLTDGYNLHTSNNPSEARGKGGSCFGDSVGPVMFNDTSIVVAVVSFGMNNNCKGADFSYRVDTQDSINFISSYLGD
jgi:hypothetical protein